MKMLKKLLWTVAIPAILLLCAYLLLVYQNNRSIAYPQKAQLRLTLDKSIQWLLKNEEKIVNDSNSMLWWMLYEAQKTAPDARLQTLLDSWLQRHKSVIHSPWGPLFNGRQHDYLGAYSVQGLPYYNQHFIYALNCAKKLADELPIVAQQNEAAFCHQAEYFYRPACTTHQLMGINFLFTGQCNLLAGRDEVSGALQRDIVRQLTWDVRVVDVYLQRVLMLLITGAEASVEAVWIQQVLDHQLDDGSWGDFDPLFELGDSTSLGFSARALTVRQAQGSFHATAQGVYLLSYLIAGRDNGE